MHPDAATPTTPGDYRRAAVLTLHHRQGGHAGVAAIIDEANEADRAAHLLFAVLHLHARLIAALRTNTSAGLMADYLRTMANLDADEPLCRAARIIDQFGRRDLDAIGNEITTDATAGQATEVFMQMLNLYENVLPELSSPVGMDWISRHVNALLRDEA